MEHESWRDLLRSAEPHWLSQLLMAAGLKLPEMGSLREASEDLTQLVPVQFTADAVLIVGDPTEHVVLIEVQRRVDGRKRMSWPVYVASLHARHKCPVTLLVVCPSRSVAKWAREPISFGTGASLQATVVGPDELPLMPVQVPDEERDFVLAVLSAAMHVGEPQALEQAKVLGAAVLGSRPERDEICYRLLEDLFGSAFSTHMEDIMGERSWYDDSPVFSKVQAKALAKGQAEGHAAAVLAVLAARGLEISELQRQHVESCRDIAQLDAWLARAATATATTDVFSP